MRLFAAIVAKFLQSALIVVGLMAVLFTGYLVVTYLWPTVRTLVEAPTQIDQIRDELGRHSREVEARETELEREGTLIAQIRERIEREEDALRGELEQSVKELEEMAARQQARVYETIEQNREHSTEALSAIEREYCSTWNPIKWVTCQRVRARMREFEANVERQRQALSQAALRVEENASAEARKLREDAERELERRTAQMQDELRLGLERFEAVEAERQRLAARADELLLEEQLLHKQHWLAIELERRWPGLLLAALLIFFAPFIRRTLWYFLGMPLVSRARPLQLMPASSKGEIQTHPSARTIEVTVPTGSSLSARSGYIQSDRLGARSALFFDWKAPNLSYASGLIMLTRLEAEADKSDGRLVSLGSPDDPDAYLMEICLDDHPGVVLRARNIVAVVGAISVTAHWRLTSWHAWATSQVRFLTFSGSGSIIVEGYGDVAGHTLEQDCCEKRMPLVIGFDTRLAYKTRRTATFLPYLLDPEREPLVVDVFEGKGMFFHQKNPTSHARQKRTGEHVANFFLDAVRKLLGF
ncbi:MAG: hypothetical protein H0U74_01925 [Bradymonadaceae bacterium]|nr:hypothetical protein [Lujinxingiaceae bacterium]